MASPSPSRLSPPAIPTVLHSLNREKLFNSLREHLTSCARPLQGIVLLQGGKQQTQDSTNHIELFRQESYFAYLFGVIEPGFYGAIDIASGKSTLFAPSLPADYAVSMGETESLSYFQEKYKVTQVFHTDEITEVLLDQYQATGTPLLFLLHGLNTDSNKYTKPAEFQGIEKFQRDLNTLHPILTECRAVKSDLELPLIQFANDISSEAHVEKVEEYWGVINESDLHRRYGEELDFLIFAWCVSPPFFIILYVDEIVNKRGKILALFSPYSCGILAFDSHILYSGGYYKQLKILVVL